MLKTAQTSTSYLVPDFRVGVVYSLCVALLTSVLLQLPGGPLDGLSRYLTRYVTGVGWLLPEGGPHVMTSPYMVVDGLTLSDDTEPGAIGETCV